MDDCAGMLTLALVLVGNGSGDGDFNGDESGDLNGEDSDSDGSPVILTVLPLRSLEPAKMLLFIECCSTNFCTCL